MKTTPAFLIAAPHSGSGKSMIASGLMALFAETMIVQGFKIGPDFIDPMLHTFATGRSSINLDPWILTPYQNQALFHRYTQTADLAIVEGVMGLFDGLGSNPLSASSAGMAHALHLPIILVIDCKGMSGSAAAIAHGFHTYCPGVQLAGIICNRVGSPRHANLLRDALTPTGIPLLGCIPNEKDLLIPERKLGLVPVMEQPELFAQYLTKIKKILRQEIDREALLSIAKQPREYSNAEQTENFTPSIVKIGVACDQAFPFHYEENLNSLRRAGAEIMFFSPLHDTSLPDGIDGVYISGGYPDRYAEMLSSNQLLCNAILRLAQAGAPIYAESGGAVYLSEGFQIDAKDFFPFANVFPSRVRPSKKLSMGYREIVATFPNWLLPQGKVFRGHEFHYFDLEDVEQSCPKVGCVTPPLSSGNQKNGSLLGRGNTLLSPAYLFFQQDLHLAQNFVQAAVEFQNKRKL